MGKEELLAEIEKSVGKIELVRKVCQFQSSVHDNFYSYCKQIKDQIIDGQIHYKDIPALPI
jgi:hypothetical protein